MKLFLTWLVCVPVLVAAMVLARAMSPQGLRAPMQIAIQPGCSQQRQAGDMAASVANDRHRIACNGRTVQ